MSLFGLPSCNRGRSGLGWKVTAVLAALVVVLMASPAHADELDSGDTAWMLTATALVLFMTIPGLSLFYGGLVRSKNVLSVLMQCFAITAWTTILWVVILYSFAFDTGGMEAGVKNLHTFVGGLGSFLMLNLTADSMTGTIPESVFASFQLTFAIITPALICGAYAERMKFTAMLAFTTFWLILVYAPICHMAWSGDGALFWDWGVLDFAGGTVVHINAGIAALVAAIIIGKRTGFPKVPMPPHNMTMTVTGAGMLWVGWFGFNAGSAVAANGSAGMAMLVTQIATGTAAFVWMVVEWIKQGKPSALGIATGAVAGLVAITPASGSVGPIGGLAIGVASGILCFIGATTIKHAGGYDDSLDAFGVHGIGGIVGALMTGIFAAQELGGQIPAAELPGGGSIAKQLLTQAESVGVTIIWSGVVSAVILLIINATIGLRVNAEQENLGLDLTLHDEQGYIL